KAARKAFPSFSTTTVEERIALLHRIVEEYEKRKDDIVRTVTAELGVPLKISEKSHYHMGLEHFQQTAKELETFIFEEQRGGTLIRKEPIRSEERRVGNE